jgi:branched-chain amino acid transport system substrate-binding protein
VSSISCRQAPNGRQLSSLSVRGAGATKFNDLQHFPWTMGWLPSYQSEARVYAQYLLKNHPHGKVGVLYQNDDYPRVFRFLSPATGL